VQIVWDILIRPDGYQIELEGMNGVDPQGMAGLKAAYKENWFEYVKAAGTITLFSIANAKLTEEVTKRTSDEMGTAVVTANAEFIRDIGGGLISRATEIQPTLTVANGERISVMLNKNIFLPPVDSVPVTQKYTLR
jgi:type IV secretory pathway VirB10-like protein